MNLLTSVLLGAVATGCLIAVISGLMLAPIPVVLGLAFAAVTAAFAFIIHDIRNPIPHGTGKKASKRNE